MNEEFNKEHAASIDYVNQAVAGAWDKMKVWMMTNVDKLDYIVRVIDRLKIASRKDVGETAIEYADHLATAVQSMVRSFENAGLDMSGISTSDFATCIDSLVNNTGAYIHDSDGLLWTAANWAYETERLHHEPATFEGIMLQNPDHNFLVAGTNYGPMMFGTYSHTIPNLQIMDGGVSGTPKDGSYNSWKILAGTEPDLLRPEGRAIDYFEGMTRADIKNPDGTDKVDVVFFPDDATLTAWANAMGLYEMITIGQTMMYAVPHASTTATEKYWVLKYFSGTTSIAFANREAVVPYKDNYAQTGCPPARACFEHREHEADPNFWRNGSLFELVLIHFNKDAINECRAAHNAPALPAGSVWSCLQSNINGEYSLDLVGGSYTLYNKNIQWNVVPVASQLRPSALE